MTKYESLRHLKPQQFRRLTGVQPKTFEKMTSVLLEAEKKQETKGVIEQGKKAR